MDALIKIETRQIGGEAINAVSARDLHGFLEVGKIFAAWIKERIEQYGFTEGRDFVCFPESESKGRGGQNRIEYALSLDMAKELSMVERNAKGKEARQYFLECERRAKQPLQVPVLNWKDPVSIRAALMQGMEEVLALEAKVGTLKTENGVLAPKAEALDLLCLADGSMCITNAAKTVNMQPHKLFSWLQSHKWIYRRVGGNSWVAYQDKIQRMLLEHKITTIEKSDGGKKVVEQVLVTAKGLAMLAQLTGGELVEST